MTANISEPTIYLITEDSATDENFAASKSRILAIIRRAVQFNISMIQIREKKLCGKLLFELAREAAEITAHSKTKLLINDRADIALAANADGVHLTANSISAEIIRREFPAKFIIGVSAHTFDELQEAKNQHADFAVYSPIFALPHKGKPKGLNDLRKVCGKLAPFPILALGGIDENNYLSVADAGAKGFAAIRFLNDEGNLEKLSQNRLRQRAVND